jgi:hypothetical protein
MPSLKNATWASPTHICRANPERERGLTWHLVRAADFQLNGPHLSQVSHIAAGPAEASYTSTTILSLLALTHLYTLSSKYLPLKQNSVRPT